MEKNCTRCDISQPLDSDHFGKRKTKTEQGWRWDSWCRDCYKANTKKNQTKNPELKKQRDKEWREKNSERYHAQKRLKYAQMSTPLKQRMVEHHRKNNNKMKREAMERYGGAFCHCCGETELLMLCLDHVESNGAAHRRGLTGSGRRMPIQSYIWAKKNNWPPIFQVSCHNCNWARHWTPDKRCPHEIRRQQFLTEGTVRLNHAA